MTVELITRKKDFVVSQYWYNGEWNGEDWITLTDIVFSIDLQKFTIKAGFVTDFASIPSLSRVTINRIGRAVIGFVIHDYLRKDGKQEIPTKKADKALYEFMRMFGESWYTSNKVYYALRGFGWAVTVGPNIYSKIDPKVIDHICKSNKYIKTS